MRFRIIGLLLVGWCWVCSPISAQFVLLRPEVEIVSSGVSVSNTRQIEDLRTRIVEYLAAYTLPFPIMLLPIQPVPVRIQLTLRSGDSQRYVGDIEVVMTRPVYGSMKQTPIFVSADREVPFEVNSNIGFASYGQDLPTDPLVLRLLYRVYEGLVSYYDSMDVYGGDAIIEFMKRERAHFGSAWDVGTVRSGLTAHTPERYLMELESPPGMALREIWYIYHREVLDSERTDVAEQNMSLVLPLMSELYREQQIPVLFRLLSDTKAHEIATVIDGMSASQSADLRAVFREVFPTFALH